MENKEQPKKCFCTRCFIAIDPNDKVEVDGQNFHRMCGMCCICRKVPETLKMFYGHVFCNDCFNCHVMSHFKGEGPRARSSNWWMQWNPYGQCASCSSQCSSDSTKRSVCTRCLQLVDEKDSISISGQVFHNHCARCYYCQTVPKSTVKVYYGQVFCEECFHKHVMQQNKDNPSEFFKSCFEQWQQNPQFADSMKDFMGSSSSGTPFVFMMQGVRCGGEGASQGFQPEPKKSASTVFAESIPEPWENCSESIQSADTIQTTKITSQDKTKEKIEKLTRYLSDYRSVENLKKWENCDTKWVDLQDKSKCVQKSPKCLWQTGSFYVKSAGKVVCVGSNVVE